MKSLLTVGLTTIGLFFAGGLFQAHAADAANEIPKGYKLQYQQDFSKKDALKDFVMADPNAWQITQVNGDSCLELVKQSKYQPEVRSPVNLAVIGDRAFGDFILEVNLLSTSREYPHRDMCISFGMKSPKEFYYTHMATAADPHAHNIFIVNNKERQNIATETTKGVNWGTTNDWHKIRIERKVADGTIKVYYDDLTKPVQVAEDKAFAFGYIGFGSFDDTGKINNIKVYAPKMEKKKTEFYKRSE
ncbi:hypothetical protein [Pedosphaera parvula]|uniref:Signal peptide protein n=1 Tax=Pedosphaera parvula (strain Ellin514) TaxID=320771 RepID=B9XN72_PEDPL|nr:hypothetical protein [Pedosphaera parvula]EEF58734.1 signal peptide protein [Pedosphaera parvula Ellin514]